MWSSGDTVVLRNIWHGRVRIATPMRVVEDAARVVLWFPAGTREWAADTPGVPRDWRLIEHTTPDDVVVVHERDWRFSVHVARMDGALRCWYVNFEDPWTRTPLGYDSRDLLLDIWVDPDRSWRFLDEDELEEAEREKIVSTADAALIRAEGERVAGMIEGWEPPFSDNWETWWPDPSWEAPVLPPHWDEP
jgi:hypothetical protein